MTEIHKAKCDKCGKEKNMRMCGPFIDSYRLPRLWKNIKKNWLVNLDLCIDCKLEYIKHSKEFFK